MQLDEEGRLNKQDLAAVFVLDPTTIQLNYGSLQWDTAGNVLPAVEEGVSEDAPIIVTGRSTSRCSLHVPLQYVVVQESGHGFTFAYFTASLMHCQAGMSV